MTKNKALHPKDDIERLYVSRKGERKLTWIEDRVDTSITRLEGGVKKNKENWLQRQETEQTRRWPTEQQLENKNGKKKNSMDISIDKQATFYTRSLEYDEEREILTEKLNLF